MVDTEKITASVLSGDLPFYTLIPVLLEANNGYEQYIDAAIRNTYKIQVDRSLEDVLDQTDLSSRQKHFAQQLGQRTKELLDLVAKKPNPSSAHVQKIKGFIKAFGLNFMEPVMRLEIISMYDKDLLQMVNSNVESSELGSVGCTLCHAMLRGKAVTFRDPQTNKVILAGDDCSNFYERLFKGTHLAFRMKHLDEEQVDVKAYQFAKLMADPVGASEKKQKVKDAIDIADLSAEERREILDRFEHFFDSIEQDKDLTKMIRSVQGRNWDKFFQGEYTDGKLAGKVLAAYETFSHDPSTFYTTGWTNMVLDDHYMNNFRFPVKTVLATPAADLQYMIENTDLVEQDDPRVQAAMQLAQKDSLTTYEITQMLSVVPGFLQKRKQVKQQLFQKYNVGKRKYGGVLLDDILLNCFAMYLHDKKGKTKVEDYQPIMEKSDYDKISRTYKAWVKGKGAVEVKGEEIVTHMVLDKQYGQMVLSRLEEDIDDKQRVKRFRQWFQSSCNIRTPRGQEEIRWIQNYNRLLYVKDVMWTADSIVNFEHHIKNLVTIYRKIKSGIYDRRRIN